MTIKINIDHSALTAIIENDPEFKLQVQDHILNDVIKKIFVKNIDKMMLQSAPIALAALKDDAFIETTINETLNKRLAQPKTYWDLAKPSKGVQETIDKAVSKAVDVAMVTIDRKLSSDIQKRIETYLAENEAVIAKRIEARLDQNVAKEVDRLVDERMRRIMEGVRGA